MIEHEEGNIVIIDSDDMMVCGYCGIEEVIWKIATALKKLSLTLSLKKV